MQGRTPEQAEQLIADAVALDEAGVFAMVLECIPRPLAARISGEVRIPTVGIGAGPDVDGQILVLYDILDITRGRTPRFVQNFQAGHESPLAALQAYVQAVKNRDYPRPEHCFS